MSIPKLLYVDDELINLQLFRYNFEEEFELYLASSGNEALKLIEKPWNRINLLGSINEALYTKL